jgi:hypothetical protein
MHGQQPRPAGWQPARPIDYDTVCVHHISPNRMYALRARVEYEQSQEWTQPALTA